MYSNSFSQALRSPSGLELTCIFNFKVLLCQYWSTEEGFVTIPDTSRQAPVCSGSMLLTTIGANVL